MKEQMPIKAQGKIIGFLKGSQFVKTVLGSKHKLRFPPAWAIDAAAYEKDVRNKAREILITDKETGLKYRTSVEEFEAFKRELDRGFGRQYFLPIKYWAVEKTEEEQLIRGG